MGKIFETIKSFLTKDEIHYSLNESNDIFSFGFNTEHGAIREKILVNEEKEWFWVTGFFPNNIPVKYIDKVYPILNELNRLQSGNFVKFCVDPQDGELSCTWIATVKNEAINEQIVQSLIYTVVKSIDNEYENIMKVVYN
ncbi:MAG: YbjN domain-containing protein [Dysgonamonadaceae bacterium]|jgi:hypothetical protein|nr:YbjN domain-containing protein [Dysgonamonadaceae bacterium]